MITIAFDNVSFNVSRETTLLELRQMMDAQGLGNKHIKCTLKGNN